MAACCGVRCATDFVAASISFSSEAIADEVRAARPRPLPASARKPRRSDRELPKLLLCIAPFLQFCFEAVSQPAEQALRKARGVSPRFDAEMFHSPQRGRQSMSS